MSFSKISLTQFTAFDQLDLSLSPGINVFIGRNGTGKTHILKLLYSAAAILGVEDDSFARKIVRVFLPHENRIGRLVRRRRGLQSASISIQGFGMRLNLTFSTRAGAGHRESGNWQGERVGCAYIPVKEMLANAPGFRSLYKTREVAFEEVYADIVDRAYLPPKRGPMDASRARLLKLLEKAIEGKVVTKGETFFLRNSQGTLEFTLLAEGMRKIGLLWTLLNNETLLNGSVLLWDEPEANLNPHLISVVVQVLLELQRMGVQVFIATHDYVTLKELDLRRKQTDNLVFHSFYRPQRNEGVVVESKSHYQDLEENAITDTFLNLYNTTLKKSLGEKL